MGFPRTIFHDNGEHFYNLYKELYVKLTLAFKKSFMDFVKEIQED